MYDVVTGGVRYLAANGPRAALRRVVTRVRPQLYMHEAHVWSALVLAGERPRLALPAGYTLARAGATDLPKLAELDVDVELGRQRLADGAELWLISHGAETVYCGWVFHGRAPTIAAPGGWVNLPRGIVNPEDMVTAPTHRGRGLASAAYTLLCDDLQRGDRASRIVGKVPVDNSANRRALVKSGWREFALVDFRRVGPWRRTTVRQVEPANHDPGADELTAWLASAMGSRSGR